MKTKILLVALGVLVAMTTCTKDIYAPDVCFGQNILPLFISNCTMSGCHNSRDKEGGYDLSNYKGIMRGVKPRHPLFSEVYKVIKGNNPSMPQQPYSKLNSKDVSLIKLWINAGASETSNCVTCDSLNFTYNARISTIMKNWCVGCHNAGNSSAGIDLSNYKGVSSAIEKSVLLGSIKHEAGYVAMPQTGQQMDACEIQAVEKWIAAGHPDN